MATPHKCRVGGRYRLPSDVQLIHTGSRQGSQAAAHKELQHCVIGSPLCQLAVCWLPSPLELSPPSAAAAAAAPLPASPLPAFFPVVLRARRLQPERFQTLQALGQLPQFLKWDSHNGTTSCRLVVQVTCYLPVSKNLVSLTALTCTPYTAKGALLAAPQHVTAAFCYKLMTAGVLRTSLYTLGDLLLVPGVKSSTSSVRLPCTAQLTIIAAWQVNVPAGYCQLENLPGRMLGKLLLAAAPVLLKGFDQVHARALLAEAAGACLFQELFGLGMLGADALALVPAAVTQVRAAVICLAASCGLPPLAPCRPPSLQAK